MKPFLLSLLPSFDGLAFIKQNLSCRCHIIPSFLSGINIWGKITTNPVHNNMNIDVLCFNSFKCTFWMSSGDMHIFFLDYSCQNFQDSTTIESFVLESVFQNTQVCTLLLEIYCCGCECEYANILVELLSVMKILSWQNRRKPH